MRLINEDAVMEIIERVTNEAVEKKQPKYLIQPRIIAEIAGLPTIEAEPDNGWISVKDKLPEPYENVLVFGNFNGIATYRVDYLDDYGRWFRTFYVTHWRTLPEPPKGE